MNRSSKCLSFRLIPFEITSIRYLLPHASWMHVAIPQRLSPSDLSRFPPSGPTQRYDLHTPLRANGNGMPRCGQNRHRLYLLCRQAEEVFGWPRLEVALPSFHGDVMAGFASWRQQRLPLAIMGI
jgi:hypothetical protein